VRPHGRTSAAALAAVSVLATAGVTVATPGIAYAASNRLAAVADISAVAAAPESLRTVAGPAMWWHGDVYPTQSSLAVDKSEVSSGQSIVLTGRLTFGKGQEPVVSQSVRLESKADGQWKTVAYALSDADGGVTFTVKPSASTKFRLAHSGVPALAPSQSVEQSVSVRAPVRATATASRSASSGSSGSTRVAASVGGIGSNGASGSATAQAVVEAAASHSGKQYVYATAGPNTFDCSGLVKYVLAQFGVSLPHNAHAQMSYGTPVSAADAAPGDLIFFLDGGYAYHVGIYAGGNKMIDAPNSRSTVGLHTIWSSNVVFRRIV
jgi:cell wall-associated NlpC family hydrolase